MSLQNKNGIKYSTLSLILLNKNVLYNPILVLGIVKNTFSVLFLDKLNLNVISLSLLSRKYVLYFSSSPKFSLGNKIHHIF